MKSFLITLLFLVLFYPVHTFGDASVQVILTWQAMNYYPSNYLGKSLAVMKTAINVSVEVVQDNKFIDLTGAEFLWYLDGKLLKRGGGLKEIFFTAQNSVGEEHFIRVEIQKNDKEYEASIKIPVSKPSVVIDAPFAENFIGAAKQITVQAVPYFFNVQNVSDLTFFWDVNRQIKKSGSGNQLTLTLGEAVNYNDNGIQIMVSVQNPKNVLEFGKRMIRLKIR